MKTLKIVFAVAAVSLLTVSGVQSENVVTTTAENQDIKQPTKIELIAHVKTKIKKPTHS
ncbi:hypothetical protein HNV08_03890 [Winogradskyella eckloniae]|uniref:hypothetical protein n=1 Tax=Winogradskyella eckloniae TaxID=1089306 RepID=UPI001563E7AA|nr:hypothetical protein [Winogradskyella eckloniae]NRD19178.1 hypothetical protein [Winogradskyella eckloniae]